MSADTKRSTLARKFAPTTVEEVQNLFEKALTGNEQGKTALKDALSRGAIGWSKMVAGKKMNRDEIEDATSATICAAYENFDRCMLKYSSSEAYANTKAGGQLTERNSFLRWFATALEFAFKTWRTDRRREQEKACLWVTDTKKKGPGDTPEPVVGFSEVKHYNPPAPEADEEPITTESEIDWGTLFVEKLSTTKEPASPYGKTRARRTVRLFLQNAGVPKEVAEAMRKELPRRSFKEVAAEVKEALEFAQSAAA